MWKVVHERIKLECYCLFEMHDQLAKLSVCSESINCQRFEYFTLNDRTYRVEDPVFLPLWIWLMLSYFIASRCSPSVLDRLNPLLEPNGVLSIDGRGIVGDSVPTITPHPNFRYILSCIHIAIGLGDQCIKEERNLGEVWYFLQVSCYNYKHIFMYQSFRQCTQSREFYFMVGKYEPLKLDSKATGNERTKYWNHIVWLLLNQWNSPVSPQDNCVSRWRNSCSDCCVYNSAILLCPLSHLQNTDRNLTLACHSWLLWHHH